MKLDKMIERVNTLVEKENPEDIDFGGSRYSRIQDILDIKQDVAEFNEDATTIYTDIEDIESNISNLKSTVATLNSDMQNLLYNEDIAQEHKDQLTDVFNLLYSIEVKLQSSGASLGALLNKVDDASDSANNVEVKFSEIFGEQ